MRAACWSALLPLLAGACSGLERDTPYQGACAPFALVASTPAANEIGVSRGVTIELVFNDYVDPDSVGLDTLVLTTGNYRRTGAYSVDLVDKSVRFKPTGLLQPDLTFGINARSGLRSLQGCTMARDELRSFRTGSEGAEPPARPSAPFAPVLDVFRRGCWGSACHRDDEPGSGRPCTVTGREGAHPGPRGLSLCDDLAYDLLVSHPSVEVSRLSRVEPHDSARSFLMRKILPGPDGQRPTPGTPGERMGHRPDAPLGPADWRLIQDWIDAGAAR